MVCRPNMVVMVAIVKVNKVLTANIGTKINLLIVSLLFEHLMHG